MCVCVCVCVCVRACVRVGSCLSCDVSAYRFNYYGNNKNGEALYSRTPSDGVHAHHMALRHEN